MVVGLGERSMVAGKGFGGILSRDYPGWGRDRA